MITCHFFSERKKKLQVGRLLREQDIVLNLRDFLSWADFLCVSPSESIGRLP
jgi:hypothetical protein